MWHVVENWILSSWQSSTYRVFSPKSHNGKESLKKILRSSQNIIKTDKPNQLHTMKTHQELSINWIYTFFVVDYFMFSGRSSSEAAAADTLDFTVQMVHHIWQLQAFGPTCWIWWILKKPLGCMCWPSPYPMLSSLCLPLTVAYWLSELVIY